MYVRVVPWIVCMCVFIRSAPDVCVYVRRPCNAMIVDTYVFMRNAQDRMSVVCRVIPGPYPARLCVRAAMRVCVSLSLASADHSLAL